MSFNSIHSAKSSSNSKRSFNSTSTNHTSTRSNSKRQRKENGQKTLGMAWGSTSRSSSFRNSPFPDPGSYMAVKNKKLHEQFDAEASTSSHGSKKPVFSGVSIFVDGYTIPSSQELRGYMLKHGGRFENYFSKKRVTHILCSNLPNSKLKNLRSFSRGLPVVKPTWVLDCLAADKLLSWVPYELDQLASQTSNLPKLSAFLGLRTNTVQGDPAGLPMISNINISEVNDSADEPNQEFEGYVSDSCDEEKPEEPTCSNNCEKKVSEVKDTTDVPDQEFEGYVSDSSDEEKPEEPTCSNNGEKNVSETNEVIAETQSKCSPCQPSTSEVSRYPNVQNIAESLPTVSGSSKKGHSTSFDPNFVETYFKNSRLHFIGTWRNRYRKLFPTSSDVFKPSSSINASSISQTNTVIHIDMDCFFVQVVIRNRPELLDKPVAVCHSDNPRGTSEISSANYPARDLGVRAGIFVREAKALCPHLIIVPYNFEAYEEVADKFYSILHKHCNKVQAMSCDEAILDITDLEVDDTPALASLIRKEIYETTGCTASAGISNNMLMARLATRSAKPDGQCYLPPDKVNGFLKELSIKVLPGIGRALGEKLKGRNVQTCGDLRMLSKESLQKDFGQKTGDMLWNYCRGIDNRPVGLIQECKSVGADVNWGIRFKDLNDSQVFLLSLCKEVSLRLHGCGVRGRTFTLKVKKRKTDEEPVKYMGCGDCDNFSHSLTVPMATNDVDVLQRISKQLFSHFHIDVEDIRGIGLQVTKLESADNLKQGTEKSSIRSWLVSASASVRECSEVGTSSREKENEDKNERIDQLHQSRSNTTLGSNLPNREANHHSDVPPLCDLDPEVLESLPPEIFSEMNDLYGGNLKSFMAKRKFTGVDVGTSFISPEDVKGNRASLGPQIPKNVAAASTSHDVDMMPTSWSQIDPSVLDQLPEEIRIDILNHLPAPGDPKSRSNELWVGTPPKWVEKFKSSDSRILKFLANTYNGLGSNINLSTVLLKSVSATEVCNDEGTTECDELGKLLKQYIDMKAETDLEEIHTCFRILKRLSSKSELFSQVYNIILPHLQMSVRNKYGGTLHI